MDKGLSRKEERNGERGEARGNFRGDGYHMFTILIVVMVTWEYAYIKTSPITYFKYTQFFICQPQENSFKKHTSFNYQRSEGVNFSG